MKYPDNKSTWDFKKRHRKLRQYISSLVFLKIELRFMKQLLNSYVFEPKTPLCFEQVQQYKRKLSSIENTLLKLNKHIMKYGNKMQGMLECDTLECGNFYQKEFHDIKQEFKQLNEDFKNLKKLVFEYAGEILKNQKKP